MAAATIANSSCHWIEIFSGQALVWLQLVEELGSIVICSTTIHTRSIGEQVKVVSLGGFRFNESSW